MSKLAERLDTLAEFRRPSELGLLVRVVTVAMTVPVLVRLPLPRLAAVLSVVTAKSDVTAGPPEEEVTRIVSCVEAAQRAAAPLVRSGCLTRGLTLYWLLRRGGAPVELCFGVGRLGHEFAGHCWLVRDGRPYLEPGDSPACFEAVYRIPPAQD